MKKIYVAGGCFWGVQHYFNLIKGIISSEVGYANGSKDNLTYEEVCSQKYDAIEAVELVYDESIISLNKILELLFRIIDPTSLDKQGGDIGHSYRVGAYYVYQDDFKVIEDFVFNQEKNYDKEIVFEVKPLQSFVKAENYHQDYLVKNPFGYCHVDMNKIKKEELK
ncbi:MAG: peptide-methionine (S)-S-oxide reductase MsrA [Bacilli bacterium]|jgi:peptide-methionine (S)-S-oxide reductase|nr:peptide-methionine (S)-S-oxide reductase MsrA [Bacilli bacterium]